MATSFATCIGGNPESVPTQRRTAPPQENAHRLTNPRRVQHILIQDLVSPSSPFVSPSLLTTSLRIAGLGAFSIHFQEHRPAATPPGDVSKTIWLEAREGPIPPAGAVRRPPVGALVVAGIWILKQTAKGLSVTSWTECTTRAEIRQMGAERRRCDSLGLWPWSVATSRINRATSLFR